MASNLEKVNENLTVFTGAIISIKGDCKSNHENVKKRTTTDLKFLDLSNKYELILMLKEKNY